MCAFGLIVGKWNGLLVVCYIYWTGLFVVESFLADNHNVSTTSLNALKYHFSGACATMAEAEMGGIYVHLNSLLNGMVCL